MKVKFEDGKEEEFDANEVDDEHSPGGMIRLIKRDYDDEGDYSDDEDKPVALINTKDVRSIEF